ncbi:hypothetical protein BH10ACT1_BH10ACT1_22200 [soil metagenome]
MNRRPTGVVRATPEGGRELALTRTFAASAEEVWASVTEPERLARWYGTYEGEPGPGKVVQLTMTAEAGAPCSPALILECEPPRLLALRLGDSDPGWRVTITIEPRGDTAELIFVHVIDDGVDPADVGPGWEYYLDRLAAAEQGRPQAEWDDTYLVMSDHYRSPG